MSTSTPKYGERLLKSQGWRGKGYSLHPTDNTIGLSNPLRISRNTDGRGIGQSTHYTSDQWWLAAFDEKLKGLDTSKDGKVVQTTTQSKLDAVTANIGGGKYTGAGGLYASFVRGEGLAGTVGSESGSGRSTPTDREDVAGLKGGVKKRESSSSKKKKAEKEEKKRRKAMEKLKKKEEKKAAKKAAKKEEKRRRKATETKEERKARKKERRAKKEEKRRKRTSEKEKEKKG